MSRINYPVARNLIPALFRIIEARVPNVGAQLGDRWAMTSTAMVDPSERENAAWQCGRIVEETSSTNDLREELVRELVELPAHQVGEIEIDEQLSGLVNSLNFAINFHEDQARWFKDRRDDLQDLRNAYGEARRAERSTSR
jgi:hypothetical protein